MGVKVEREPYKNGRIENARLMIHGEKKHRGRGEAMGFTVELLGRVWKCGRLSPSKYGDLGKTPENFETRRSNL